MSLSIGQENTVNEKLKEIEDLKRDVRSLLLPLLQLLQRRMC